MKKLLLVVLMCMLVGCGEKKEVITIDPDMTYSDFGIKNIGRKNIYIAPLPEGTNLQGLREQGVIVEPRVKFTVNDIKGVFVIIPEEEVK